MYDVKTQVVGSKGKAHVAHRGYTLEGAMESLAYHADVPVELGTIDITFTDTMRYGELVWHMWIEEDGVPVEPVVDEAYAEWMRNEEADCRWLDRQDALCAGVRVA